MTIFFEQAGVLDMHFADKTLVSAEEIIDLPFVGVWDIIEGSRVSMGVSACHREWQ